MDYGFKPVVSTNRQAMKSNESQHSIIELTREQKGAKAINQERKIDSSSSDVIKTFTLDKPITDATVVLTLSSRMLPNGNNFAVGGYGIFKKARQWNIDPYN